MPRCRLCLGFYVCDLEFGICPPVCLFIYHQPASDLSLRRWPSPCTPPPAHRQLFASMRAVNTKGRGVLPRSAMPPRKAAPSDTNANDSSNVELIEGSHGCAFCAGLSDVLWPLGLERRTDKGQEMGSNTSKSNRATDINTAQAENLQWNVPAGAEWWRLCV